MSLLIPGIIAAAAVLFYNKVAAPAAAASQLMPTFDGLQFKSLSISKLVLLAKLNFANPSNIQFTIEQIYIDIKSGTDVIGKVLYTTPIIIAPLTASNKNAIPFDINLLKIPSYLKSSSKNLQAVGYVTANGIQFEINETIDFDISAYIKKTGDAINKVSNTVKDVKQTGTQFLNFVQSIPALELQNFLKTAKNGSLDGYKHLTFKAYQTKEWINNQYIALMDKNGYETGYKYGSLYKRFTAIKEPAWTALKKKESATLLIAQVIV